MKIEEVRQRAAQKLWSAMASRGAPTEDIKENTEFYLWVVDLLIEDPDFQRLIKVAASFDRRGRG